MKLSEALDIITECKPKGFLVAFEKLEGSVLRGDYFPDIKKGEQPFSSEKDAWEWARIFAEATYGKYVNIHVINSVNFIPVKDWDTKRIVNR